MRKKIYFIVLFLIVFSLGSFASLLNVYKNGKIKLVPDPDFGKGTKWDIYFSQGIKDIAFAKDGSFFVTGFGNKACHCVYKLDKNGKYLKKFGRKGKGPGDLYNPGDLTILDNKYLLVNNYPLDRRISVFDLKGNFIKIIRTKSNVFDVVALENGNFVCLSESFGDYNKFFIYLRNITGVKRKLLIKFSEKRKKASIRAEKYYGKVFLRSFSKGTLLVAFNNSKKIHIFDKNGTLIRTFEIKGERRKVDKKDKISFYKIMEGQAKKYPFLKRVIKKMYHMDIFPEFVPFFDNVKVDSENNILIFDFNTYEKTKSIGVNIYSSNGEYLCHTVIDTEVPVESSVFEEGLFFHNASVYYQSFVNDKFKLNRKTLNKR